MQPFVHFKDLGLIDYKEAWDYQEKLFKGTIDQKIRIRMGILMYRQNIIYCFVNTHTSIRSEKVARRKIFCSTIKG